MNASKMRLLKLISGIILFLDGCIFLIISVLYISRIIYNGPSIIDIISCLFLVLLSILLYLSSVECFIQYGMTKGIDYTLQKKHNTTCNN